MKKPTRSEQESYRLLFFVIAQVMMLSMGWLLFQEFAERRPWKGIQDQWAQVEEARALKNLSGEKTWLEKGVLVKEVDGEEEETPVKDRVDALKKEIAELEGGILDSGKAQEVATLKADLKIEEVKTKDAEIVLAFAKADEDEAYYFYRSAKHHGHHEEAEKLKAKFDEIHEEVLEKSAAYDAATKKRDTVLDKLSLVAKTLNAKKKELENLEGGLSTAERALDAARSQRHDVRQFWNQRIDLVDRCHTCHMGFDRCGFTDPEEILHYTIEENLTAQDIRRRYCVTREEAEAYLEARETIVDSWYEDEKLGYKDVQAQLLAAGNPEGQEAVSEPVLATAKALGVESKAAEALFRTHPHAWQLLRKHPADRYGCTTCHYGQGRQTKGVGLNYLAAALWKGSQNLAPFDHAKSDHYWEAQLLDTERHHTESSCFNCHAKDYELEYAPHLTEGRKLVQHLGCTGCHPLGDLDPDRKHGPSLRKVASKIDAGWMYAWLKDPQSLRPRTRMPNFWPDASSQGKGEGKLCNKFDFERGSPPAPAEWMDCEAQREEEAAYILKYLLDKSEEQTYAAMPAWADAGEGKRLFESIGCQGCHNMGEWKQASTMPGSHDRDVAPNLAGIGDKIRDPGWFYLWLQNPSEYWSETRMPSLRLTDKEAWHLAAYLSGAKSSGPERQLSPRARTLLRSPGAAKKGEQLIAYYGCFGCHEVEGFDGRARIGADLTLFGSKPAHKLDFGDVAELVEDPHAQTWEAWTRKKLATPRAFTYERATTRMPQFNITPAEMDAAIIFLKSQNERTKDYPEDVKHMQSPEDAAIARGAFLVDIYNCRGCHLIDDRGIDVDGDHQLDGGDIYRLYAGTPEAYRAPPKLINQGAKVYPDWFFGFLKKPFKLRENFKLRMPTFPLSDARTKDIVAYFAAKAKKPYPYIEKKRDVLSAEDRKVAAQLFQRAQCTNCHNLGGGTNDPKNVAPNLRLTADRLQYDWLFDWFKDPQVAAPGVGMPNFFSPVEDEPGVYETPLVDIAGGDWKRQIELLRAYVIELGVPSAQADKSEGVNPRG